MKRFLKNFNLPTIEPFPEILVLPFIVVALISLGGDRIRHAELPEAPEPTFIQSGEGPQRIQIPAIGVNAQIEAVGRTTRGNMSVPISYQNAGWYRHGPKPGDIGNAVIAGHLDTGSGKSAVFYKLGSLRPGDKIIVESGTGKAVEFVVRESELVSYKDTPREVLSKVFGESEQAHLNLITCDGLWMPEKRSYSERLIVYTDLVL